MISRTIFYKQVQSAAHIEQPKHILIYSVIKDYFVKVIRYYFVSLITYLNY